MKNLLTPMVGLCAAVFLTQALTGQVTATFNDLAPDYEPDPIGNPGVFVVDHDWISPLNWDTEAVPVPGDTANVGGTFTVETGGGDLQVLDGITTNFSGTAHLDSQGYRLDDAVITFSDDSTWTAGGAVAFGRDGASSSVTLNWDSSGTFTPGGASLLVGRIDDGIINQTAGIVGSPGVSLSMGAGALNSGSGTYNLYGGTVNALDLIFTANLGTQTFNFRTGSTGVLVIANGGVDYTTDLQGFIDAGNIVAEGVTHTLGDYSAYNINYTGTSTTISLAGVVGPVPVVFDDGAVIEVTPGVFEPDHNWSSPENWDTDVVPAVGETAEIGGSFTVETGSGELEILDGITANFLGTAHLDSQGYRLDNTVMNFSDASTWTSGGAVGLGRDLSGQPATVINWDSSGTYITGGVSLLLGRKSDGIFNQTAGSVGVPAIAFQFGVGATNNGGGTYNLTAGKAICSELIFTVNNGTHAFNFTAGSTGILIVANGGADYTTALQGFIDSGLITVDGAAQTPGDYSAFTITYDTADTKSMDSIQDNEGTIQIGWLGELDRVYAIESSPDLQDPWTPLNRTWIGDGSSISANVGTVAAGEKIFYRQLGVTTISLAP